jgi:hypothetical protein
MAHLRCVIARTPDQIADAQRVRWQVYGEEERLLAPSVGVSRREVDARDLCEDTLHFIVYVGAEAVGTVRLLQGRGSDGDRGLDLGAKVDLGPLKPPLVAAEVTRFCVLRRHRCTRVTAALFFALRAESRRRGITHWVAGANMETDVVEDAALTYRLVRERGLMDARLRVAALGGAPQATPRRRPFFTEEQRLRAARGELGGLELPRPVSLFAAKMGARYIGAPVYDSYFDVFALPLLAAVVDGGSALGAASPRPRRARDQGGAALDAQALEDVL